MEEIKRPKRVSVDISDRDNQRFTEACRLLNRSKAEVVRQAIEALCKEVEDGK